MGLILFLLAAVAPTMCKTMNEHEKVVMRPCVNFSQLPPTPPLPLRCPGDRFDKSMSFPAVTGDCGPEVRA